MNAENQILMLEAAAPESFTVKHYASIAELQLKGSTGCSEDKLEELRKFGKSLKNNRRILVFLNMS